MTARLREAQNQLGLAAYDAEEAGRTIRRIDAVMDAGGWGHNEKDDARQALSRLQSAQQRVERALASMGGSFPMGAS